MKHDEEQPVKCADDRDLAKTEIDVAPEYSNNVSPSSISARGQHEYLGMQ